VNLNQNRKKIEEQIKSTQNDSTFIFISCKVAIIGMISNHQNYSALSNYHMHPRVMDSTIYAQSGLGTFVSTL